MFCYKSPKEQQLFVEIYINNMAEEIGLIITNTTHVIIPRSGGHR